MQTKPTSVYAIPDTSTPERRLAALDADINLKHTGAWCRAYAEVHPRAATDAMSLISPARDAALVTELRAAVDEFQAKAPDHEATAYMEWIFSEAARADFHFAPEPRASQGKYLTGGTND